MPGEWRSHAQAVRRRRRLQQRNTSARQCRFALHRAPGAQSHRARAASARDGRRTPSAGALPAPRPRCTRDQDAYESPLLITLFAPLAARHNLAILPHLHLAGQADTWIAVFLECAEIIHRLFQRRTRRDGAGRRDPHAVRPAEAVAVAVGHLGEAEPHAIERHIVFECGVAQRSARLHFYGALFVDEGDLGHGSTSYLCITVPNSTRTYAWTLMSMRMPRSERTTPRLPKSVP